MTSNDSKQDEAATAIAAENGEDFIKSRIFRITICDLERRSRSPMSA